MTVPISLTNTLPAITAGTFNQYLEVIRVMPLLSPDEERHLFIRYQEQGDLEAAKKLVLSHLGLVIKVAKRYFRLGLPREDLVQQGNIGLMTAVKKFDLNFSVRLSTYALHWIRAEIADYIIKNWKIVKVATTKVQRQLFFNLHKLKKLPGPLAQDDAQSIAAQTGTSCREVIDMNQRICGHDESFETLGETMADEAIAFRCPLALLLEQERTSRYDDIVEAIKSLDERSRDILENRWLGERKQTLASLASKYRLSKERVRQIETAALATLKKQLADESQH
ncbi:RNA polymerase factor sigma-32 [Exilibacterium tricleocarpae]|nr:RNA polymerase factor sigma-32 [Exilibacterium tricleocarpae]